MSNDSRAEFEAWACTNFACSPNALFLAWHEGTKRYVQETVQAAWEGWQAHAGSVAPPEINWPKIAAEEIAKDHKLGSDCVSDIAGEIRHAYMLRLEQIAANEKVNRDFDNMVRKMNGQEAESLSGAAQTNLLAMLHDWYDRVDFIRYKPDRPAHPTFDELLKSAQAPSLEKAQSRVFVDMDGVVVNFDAYKERYGLTGDEVKKQVGAYLNMEPYPEALDGLKSLIGAGFDVWLATKPPTGIAHAYADKAEWVFLNLPELKRKIIITHDKGLLGCERDFLIDDRPHKANCEKFRGTLIRFVNGMTWPKAVEIIRTSRETGE